MRAFLNLSLSLLLLLLCIVLIETPPARAGWGGGDCGPVGPMVNLQPAPILAAPSYSWSCSPDDPDAWALRLNGELIGGYRPSTGKYHSLVNGNWLAACQAPVALPAKPSLPAQEKKASKAKCCPCCGEECNCAIKPCGKPGCKCVFAGATIESDGSLNFGLDRSAIKQRPRSIVNGREVDKQVIFDVLGKGKASVPDDASQLCLTVIGSPADTASVINDLASAPALAAWKDQLKLQVYEPSHWAVKDAGFVTTGKPTIYCQAPDGTVLHRQDSYAGPDALAEALRQADPSYQPAKDPNLNNPLGLNLDDVKKWLESVPGWVWAAIAVVLYLHFTRQPPAAA